MTHASLLFVLAATLTAPLGACSMASDPLYQPGTWAAHDDNDANLLSMLDDPRDLQQGRDARTARGAAAADAVGRLLTDKTRPLGVTSGFTVGGGSGSGH